MLRSKETNIEYIAKWKQKHLKRYWNQTDKRNYKGRETIITRFHTTINDLFKNTLISPFQSRHGRAAVRMMLIIRLKDEWIDICDAIFFLWVVILSMWWILRGNASVVDAELLLFFVDGVQLIVISRNAFHLIAGTDALLILTCLTSVTITAVLMGECVPTKILLVVSLISVRRMRRQGAQLPLRSLQGRRRKIECRVEFILIVC